MKLEQSTLAHKGCFGSIVLLGRCVFTPFSRSSVTRCTILVQFSESKSLPPHLFFFLNPKWFVRFCGFLFPISQDYFLITAKIFINVQQSTFKKIYFIHLSRRTHAGHLFLFPVFNCKNKNWNRSIRRINMKPILFNHQQDWTRFQIKHLVIRKLKYSDLMCEVWSVRRCVRM